MRISAIRKAVQIVFVFLFACGAAFASAAPEAGSAHGGETANIFLWIALILFLAKVSSLVEKVGQPAVLGEILVGVLLGNLGLLGIHQLEPIGSNAILGFLAELGVVILLFQIGLESSVSEMRKVGLAAMAVAVVGVVVPFVLGTYLVGPWLLPGNSFQTYLFLGATLTATSVGITARVFQDLGFLKHPEAKIVLGAAVIDDVLGLVILSVVTLIVTSGAASFAAILWISAKALLFLAGSIWIGQWTAPLNNRIFAKLHTGVGMKFALAMAHCLVFAYAAYGIGLAPIVGAFAAGLVMTPVHFKNFESPLFVRDVERVTRDFPDAPQKALRSVLDHHADHHVTHLIEPLAHFLVPIFFVVTGFHVKLEALGNPKVLVIALGVTAAAVAGKIVSGLAAGKVNKWIVGFGMIPRGEVGLIFAMIGRSLGVLTEDLFSVIVGMVMLTTLMTPPILAAVIRKARKKVLVS